MRQPDGQADGVNGKADEAVFDKCQQAHQEHAEAGKGQMPSVGGLEVVEVVGNPVAGIGRHIAELPTAQVDAPIGVREVDDCGDGADHSDDNGHGNGPEQAAVFEARHFRQLEARGGRGHDEGADVGRPREVERQRRQARGTHRRRPERVDGKHGRSHRSATIGQPGLRDDAGQADEDHEGRKLKDKGGRQVHVGGIEREQAEQKADDKSKDRDAVREQFPAVVDGVVAAQSLAPDLAQVLTPAPQAGQHEKKQRTEGDVGDAGRRRRGIGLLRADIPPCHTAQADGHHVEEGKKPHAHGDVEIEQVGEADDLEVRAKVDPDGAAQKGHPEVEVDLWDEVEIAVQGVDRADERGNGKADPSKVIAVKRCDDLVFGAGTHFDGQGGQREVEPLALDPLFAQHDEHAQRGEVHVDDKQAPRHKRRRPSPPRDAFALGVAFKQLLDGRAVLRHEELRYIGLDGVGPVVFRGGVVKEPAEERDQVHGQAPRGNGGPHDHHYVHGGQLAGVQAGAGEQFGERVDEQGDEKKQEQGRAGRVVGGHGRAAHHQDAKRFARGDGEAADGPDGDGAEGDAARG